MRRGRLAQEYIDRIQVPVHRATGLYHHGGFVREIVRLDLPPESRTISFLSMDRKVPRNVTAGVTPGMPLVVPIERPRRGRPYCPKTNPGRTTSNRQTKRILDRIKGLLPIL